MKQKLFTKIIALALCTASVPVQATSVRQSGDADVFVVRGNSFTPYESVPVVALVPGVDKSDVSALIASGGDISDKVIYIGTAVADANGELSYTIPVGTETEKNVYKVDVAGEQFDVGFEKNATRIELVDLVANAGDSLPVVLEQNYVYLSIDNKMYESCSGAAAIGAVLKKELAKTPVSSDSENALSKLSEMLDKSILTVAANEKKLTSITQVDEKFSECTNTKTVRDLIVQMTEKGEEAFLRDFQGNKYLSVDEADERCAKEIALKAICYPCVKTSTALLNVIDNYNSALGLNLSGFNKLSEANRAQAIVKFSEKNPTVATMQDTLDDIVKEYNKPTTTSPSGGGGGGGGGGFVAPSSPSASDSSVESQAGGSVFNDLTNVSWAKDAILTLHAKGIISGYGNKVFAPNNSIKREEFIRLVVSAYYPDEKADNVAFDDVDAGAWYHDSVAVAVSKGIVSGISEMCFGTGMNITRQDMAVILYRVAGGRFTVKDTENKFADDGAISDYAKDAVYALRDAGIISGVSATDFAPQKNATRAETAVMLYRFMNSYGGGV